MYISPEVLEDIRAGNDIVNLISSYIMLNRRGNSYVGPCPFHNDSTPSFSVSPDKQLYYCFGCGATGNVISFVMAKENLDFVSAAKFLADRANIIIPETSFDPQMKQKQKLKEDIFAMNTIAARFFYNNLNSHFGQAAKEYLQGREVTGKSQKKFGLGYSLNDRGALFKHLSDKGFDLKTIKES
ncbi:MAG: DNA primase, partial [Clostridiales bacterium]|nr:DNA primase [Clostridiales bacterium]